MSCRCCVHDRQNFCSHPRCDWSPNKYDYQLSDPRYGGHHDHHHDHYHHGHHNLFRAGQNRSYNAYNRVEVYDRRDAYFARAGQYGIRGLLNGRVDAGGFDQPAPWNDDGDQ